MHSHPLPSQGGEEGSRSLKRQAEDVYVLQGQVKVKGQWSMVNGQSQKSRLRSTKSDQGSTHSILLNLLHLFQVNNISTIANKFTECCKVLLIFYMLDIQNFHWIVSE